MASLDIRKIDYRFRFTIGVKTTPKLSCGIRHHAKVLENQKKDQR